MVDDNSTEYDVSALSDCDRDLLEGRVAQFRAAAAGFMRSVHREDRDMAARYRAIAAWLPTTPAWRDPMKIEAKLQEFYGTITEATEHAAADAAMVRAADSEKSARAGKNSGKSRAKKAEETWRLKATDLANDARGRLPRGKPSDIADDVYPKLKPRCSRPKISTLEKFISKGIAEGKIRPRAEK